MLEAADKLATASPRAVVFDKKRKGELAAKLSQRWQRWELSNFDYLMQVYPLPCLPHLSVLMSSSLSPFWLTPSLTNS